MKLDKETLTYLASIAVESYENEVAFRQGRLAHMIHRKVQCRWWCNPYRTASYVDVLEWVEGLNFPFKLRLWHPTIYKRATYAMYFASILEDDEQYLRMKNFLSGSKADEYEVPNDFYNWLLERQ